MDIPTSFSGELVVLLFAAPLAAAAAWDLWQFRIPNAVSGSHAVFFLIAAVLFERPVSWFDHLAAGAVVLLVGLVAFARGFLGGGDVKLLSTSALWFGLDALPSCLIFVALLGGVLALALIAVRWTVLGVLYLVPSGHLVRVPRVLARGESIPYGVAIAAGALLAASNLPFVIQN